MDARQVKFAGQWCLELVAPKRCMGCLREDTWLCGTCRMSLRPPPPKCLFCHPARKKIIAQGICPDCKSREPALAGIVSAAAYENEAIRRGIHWFKFRGISTLAEPLAGLMVKSLSIIAPLEQLKLDAALVPIPLSRRRERWRGYNQSWLLAAALSELTGIPMYAVLRRQKQTFSQARLPANLRTVNLQDAFAWHDEMELKRKWWLIVDDVCTSGSTLRAAAKAINAKTEGLIWGVTIARG